MSHFTCWRMARIGALLVIGGLLGLPAAQSDITGFGGGDNWSINSGGAGTFGPIFNADNDSLEVTSDDGDERHSTFNYDQQDVASFSVQFTYQMSGGLLPDGTFNPADGAAFIIQNDSRGPFALGNGGGGLGYSGIQSSAAVANNLWNNPNIPDQDHIRGTNLFTNGYVPVGKAYLDITPVNFLSMDPIQVNLTYDGTTLTEVLLDTATNDTFMTTYTIDIPGTVGSPAYVGFSGATGGAWSRQTFTGFSFTAGQ